MKVLLVREGNDANHVAVFQPRIGWRQMSLVGFEILRATLRPDTEVKYESLRS